MKKAIIIIDSIYVLLMLIMGMFCIYFILYDKIIWIPGILMAAGLTFNWYLIKKELLKKR